MAKTWRSKVPWMMEGEPWSFILLVPMVGALFLLGVVVLLPVYFVGRLLGFEKDWTWL